MFEMFKLLNFFNFTGNFSENKRQRNIKTIKQNLVVIW